MLEFPKLVKRYGLHKIQKMKKKKKKRKIIQSNELRGWSDTHYMSNAFNHIFRQNWHKNMFYLHLDNNNNKKTNSFAFLHAMDCSAMFLFFSLLFIVSTLKLSLWKSRREFAFVSNNWTHSVAFSCLIEEEGKKYKYKDLCAWNV